MRRFVYARRRRSCLRRLRNRSTCRRYCTCRQSCWTCPGSANAIRAILLGSVVVFIRWNVEDLASHDEFRSEWFLCAHSPATSPSLSVRPTNNFLWIIVSRVTLYKWNVGRCITTTMSFTSSKFAIMTAIFVGQGLHFANQLRFHHHQYREDHIVLFRPTPLLHISLRGALTAKLDTHPHRL